MVRLGLLYDVKDYKGLAEGVLNIMHDDELAEKLRVAGKEKALEFDKHTMARNIYRVYREVLGEL